MKIYYFVFFHLTFVILVDNYIYWVDSTTRKISRIKRDLSNRKAIIHTGVGSVESIAVDWIAGLS